jgi:hypothetical protein
MIEQLFGSKTRVKLLQLFYSNPNRSFYVREITRKIDEQINSVRRELANLLSIGIISSDTSDNRLYYEVNQKYDHYNELASIFGAKVAMAPEKAESLTEATDAVDAPQESEEVIALKKVGNVELALFSGKFTRDESAGVDVLIVGDVNKTKTAKYIAELEAKEGKELRYVIMPIKEFNYRKQVNDRFMTTLLHSKTQVLIDKNSVLN